MSNITGKHITLAVTGGIAAYKACDLVRLFVKAGAEVTCVMTEAAARFVAPLTFETLTGHPVYTDAFSGGMPHLALTRQSTDLLLVAPATANTIAKAANGIADNLVSSLILGRACPLAVAPAMNDRMWANPATQRNIATLSADGVHILGPAAGDLACGVSGTGRMLEPAEIFAHVERILSRPLLAGKKVVVTAGPTFEPLDPVRGITNRSSGKQGYAIAKAAWFAGAQTVLISGPTALSAPVGIKRIDVETADQMRDAVFDALGDADIFISVAAVADWKAAEVAAHKVKKTADGTPPVFCLQNNPDILQLACAAFPEVFSVGFAAETQNLLAAAKEKLVRKKARMIVGNLATDTFGRDDNAAVFVTENETVDIQRTDKMQLAEKLIAFIAQKCEESSLKNGSRK